MTKNEVVFKFKITKKDYPGIWGEESVEKIKTGNLGGVYQKLQGGNPVYNKGSFSLAEMSKAIGEVFIKDPARTSQIVIHTNQAGMDLFNKALEKEQIKKAKNEHRKKLSFRSKIFKQTYKFGQ
jgi:hypothetical protein